MLIKALTEMLSWLSSLDVRKGRWIWSKQTTLCLRALFKSQPNQYEVWCHFRKVVWLCAVLRNYLLREMNRVMPVGCPELQKGMKWSCEKDWVRTERVFVWNLLTFAVNRTDRSNSKSCILFCLWECKGFVTIALLLCLHFLGLQSYAVQEDHY